MQPEDKGNQWQPQAEAPTPAVRQPVQSSAPSAAEYDENDAYSDDEAPASLSAGLDWQASEYIHHEKQGMWFAVLIAGALVLLALAIFLLQSITFAVLVVVMTIALITFAVRQPRVLNYHLSSHGIQINDKQFAYTDFRAFGIIEDGPLYSAQLIPNKRFRPAVNLYFPSEQGEEIVDQLGARLPMRHVEPDLIDNITRRLRF